MAITFRPSKSEFTTNPAGSVALFKVTVGLLVLLRATATLLAAVE